MGGDHGQRSRIGVLGLGVVALLLASGVSSAQSTGGPTRIEGLLQELRGELQRLEAYLALADHLLRMQVALGFLQPEEAERQLTEKVLE